MRTFAILQDNKVVQIVTQEDAEGLGSAFIVDITDTPEVQLNWILVGNKLAEPNIRQAQIEAMLEAKLSAAIEFGKSLKKEMSIKIGKQNLLLNKSELEISSLVADLVSIGNLLEGGALRTAQTAILKLKSAYPEHSENFDFAITKIKVFFNE